MNRHACGSDHQGSEIAEARCAYVKALGRDLRAYAATLGKPPSPAQVDDLWAHARTMHDDGGEAARWARQVLDLGWRPVVGAPMNEFQLSVDHEAPGHETVALSRDELQIVLLALADRQDHAEAECWRDNPDDTASTHDPDCDCWWAEDARRASALAKALEARAPWL